MLALAFLAFCLVQARSILPGHLKEKERFRAVTMPPTPPASTCRNIGGYDLSPLLRKVFKYDLPQSPNNGVIYSICGTINQPCGESGDACASTPHNCTGSCQFWMESDGPQSANLGIYQSYSYDPLLNVISFNYEGGDSVWNTGVTRALFINLTCNPTAGLLTTTEFLQAAGHEPNRPYMYGIFAETALMCDGCSTYESCPSCAQTNCSWCLDTLSCVGPRRALSCRNRVKNPRLCPATLAPTKPPPVKCETFRNCDSCCSQTEGNCEWCFDGYVCLSTGSTCPNVVSNSTYCH